MTPTELRRMATDLLNDVGCAHAYKALAQYVLDTVREDDGETITKEWIESLGWTKIDRPAVYIDQSGAVEYQSWANTICCRGWGRPHVQTRGQLRRLLEGLGVTDAK